MVKILNPIKRFCVKKCGNIPPHIVEAMKQILNFSAICSLAIILMSCQKEDFSEYKITENQNSLTLKTNSTTDSVNIISINPVESNELILNPGKGFVKYYDYEEQYANIFTTKYIRFDWSDIQPQQNTYNWNLIDQEIAECKSHGKKFAFGVMSANTNRSIKTPDKGKYVTPKWVFDSGAKSRTINATYWETGQTIKQVIPVWTDAVFIAAVQNFVTALGNRYNGNPDIAFIDIRSYGNWGEQHLYELGGVDLTSAQLKAQHIQVYKNAFPNTQLISPWGSSNYNDTYEWGVNNKIGMRSDGIFKYSNGSEIARADTKAPSVFEYTAGYDWLTSEGYWNPDTLLNYIAIGKPSYIQFDSKMYEANKSLYTKIANRVGYHFVMKNVKIPAVIQSNKAFNIETSFYNKGVTNIYLDCVVEIALLNADGSVAQKKILNQSNPRSWNSLQTTTDVNSVTFDNIQGNYNIAIGLFSNANDAKPTFKLGNTGKTADNWYIIASQVSINNGL